MRKSGLIDGNLVVDILRYSDKQIALYLLASNELAPEQDTGLGVVNEYSVGKLQCTLTLSLDVS